MQFITNEQVAQALTYDKLIDALREMFQSNYNMPLRHHHFYPAKNNLENTLILMPAWNEEFLGNKQIILAPGNKEKGLPTVSALYTLFDVETGVPLCILNAEELTARRTAGKSALAADYLATQSAKTLLVLGGGKVAQHLIPAHTEVRDYDNLYLWLRNKDKFADFIQKLPQELRDKVQLVEDLEQVAREADVVSTATMSPDPLIRGEWLKEGCYLDLVGAYKPHMREVDDTAITRSSVFVDSREGALHEVGEMAIPLKKGILKEEDVKATLTELCRGEHPGRENDQEIVLFKSAGLAVEDLAGAQLAYKSLK